MGFFAAFAHAGQPGANPCNDQNAGSPLAAGTAVTNALAATAAIVNTQVAAPSSPTYRAQVVGFPNSSSVDAKTGVAGVFNATFLPTVSTGPTGTGANTPVSLAYNFADGWQASFTQNGAQYQHTAGSDSHTLPGDTTFGVKHTVFQTDKWSGAVNLSGNFNTQNAVRKVGSNGPMFTPQFSLTYDINDNLHASVFGSRNFQFHGKGETDGGVVFDYTVGQWVFLPQATVAEKSGHGGVYGGMGVAYNFADDDSLFGVIPLKGVTAGLGVSIPVFHVGKEYDTTSGTVAVNRTFSF